MSFSGSAFDKKNHNYKPKCFYLINLIKTKNPNVWTRLYEQFKSLTPEDSYDFYQVLLQEYKQLEANGWKDTKPVEFPHKEEKFEVKQYVNPNRTTKKKVDEPKVKAKAPKKEKEEKKEPAKPVVEAAKKKKESDEKESHKEDQEKGTS
jgi:outer membrane biosynthesis protein TonB